MKRLLLACAAVATGTLAQAQTPPMGRLFTTPAERLQLDIARGTAPVPPAPPPPVDAGPPPEPLVVNGFVRRGNGKSTVWVNQTAQEGVRFSGKGKSPRVGVTLPSGGKALLKPGQSVDIQSGTIKDVNAP